MSDGTEVDAIGAAIAAVEAQIAKLQAGLETLKAIGPLMGQTATTGTQRNGGDVAFGHDAFFQMKAADAAKKYLSAIKKTASPKVIADALVAGGWKSASKNIPENIRAILNRNDSFVVINGEFGLAEWYPGRKSGRRSASAASSSEDSSDSETSSSEEESSSD